MKRRTFITAIGGAAAWPLLGHAQQTAIPVIGFLDSRSLEAVTERVRGFRKGLNETGLLEGENVEVVYRWAENKNDRLSELAADLVHRQANATHRMYQST